MPVEKSIWVSYIMENLYKDNEHLEVCHREDEYVEAGKFVHIPQTGAKPTVVKNRDTLPATAVKRSDGSILYALDEFTSDPIVIPEAEKVEVSYDKVDNVMQEHIQALREVIGDEVFYNWLAGFAAVPQLSDAIAAAPVLRTSGGASAVAVGKHLPGATGNRLKFTKEDLLSARTYLNRRSVPKEERYAVMSSDMLDQLSQDNDLKKRDKALELDMRSGTIERLYGFKIIERASVATYNNTATPVVKTVGAASGTTDNDAVVCFQKSAVTAALGEVDFFERLRDPLYYGDLYSALIRMGSRKRRANADGVVAIVQKAAS